MFRKRRSTNNWKNNDTLTTQKHAKYNITMGGRDSARQGWARQRSPTVGGTALANGGRDSARQRWARIWALWAHLGVLGPMWVRLGEMFMWDPFGIQYDPLPHCRVHLSIYKHFKPLFNPLGPYVGPIWGPHWAHVVFAMYHGAKRKCRYRNIGQMWEYIENTDMYFSTVNVIIEIETTSNNTSYAQQSKTLQPYIDLVNVLSQFLRMFRAYMQSLESLVRTNLAIASTFG